MTRNAVERTIRRACKTCMTWDEGWSGKHVNSPGESNDRNKETMTVQASESEDRPLLYVEMDGEKFRLYRHAMAGFRR